MGGDEGGKKERRSSTINEAISAAFFMLGMAEGVYLGEGMRMRIRAQFRGL